MQYLYILENQYCPYTYKIGWTSRTPEERAKEISYGTGVPGKWEVAHYWQVEDGYWLEQRVFMLFARERIDKSEIFYFGEGVAVERVVQYISQFIKNTGISPKQARIIEEKKALELLEKQRLEEQKCQEILEQQRMLDEKKRREIELLKQQINEIVYSLDKFEKKSSEDFWLLSYIYIIAVAIGGLVGMFELDKGDKFLAGIEGAIAYGLPLCCVFYVLFGRDLKKNNDSDKEYKYKKYRELPDNQQQLRQLLHEVQDLYRQKKNEN